MFDLVVRGGTVVDGTGAEPFVADVAVKDGRIVAVEPSITGEAAEVIDATGKVVTPGFVDIHTHYDGQVTWDELLEPSSGHGVTTVVAGNCGVGFAPVRPGSEQWLVQLMEGVEDIPGTALVEGITWGWETFAEYLDQLDQRRWAVDVGAYVAHGPVRGYVMGERGAKNEAATADDIAQMADIVRDAIAAGALGFSTSRTLGHRAKDGEPVPGTYAAMDELDGLADAVVAGGGGMFEVAPQGLEFERETLLGEVDWMGEIAVRTGLPVSFAMVQGPVYPDVWRDVFARVDATNAAGGSLHPQVAARPFGMLIGWATYHPFSRRPTFRALAARLDGAALVAELRKPEVKAAILAETDLDPDPTLHMDGLVPMLQNGLNNLYPLGDTPDYEPTSDRTVAALAEADGVDALSKAYDLFNASDDGALLMLPFFNYAHGDHEDILEMLRHPASVSGLSDGGAHCRLICDASIPTFLLSHWVRDRSRGERLSLAEAVKLQTSDTARLVGLDDRGVIATGKRADLNVIDMDTINLTAPKAVDDLPAGGRRLVQHAVGYDATVVAGEVTRRNGVDTGARPGRLIRRGH